MTFEKGHNLSKGRPKGSSNKETKKIREMIGLLLDKNMATLQDDLDALSPKDRVAAVTNLIEYSVPKLQRTELVGDDGREFTINVVTHKDVK